MALSDLAVFSEYAYSGMTEVNAQMLDLFNAATKGCMTLIGGSTQGNYKEKAFWGKIADLVRVRNAFGTGDVAHKTPAQLIDNMVRIAAGTPPIDIDPGTFHWIQTDPKVAGASLGQQLAQDTIANMVNVSITAAVTALAATAAVLHDYASTGVVDLKVLQNGTAKFGDRANAIACWVTHSKSINDLALKALTNTENLFTFGTVQVVSDQFGRPFVVTDSTALVDTTPTPDVFYTLGLVPGGVNVIQNDDFFANEETKNGGENILRTYQAQWSYDIGLKGYRWDKENGGPSPTLAAVGSSSNWIKVATSHKDLAGVVVKSQ
jgi:hypothetical protein